VSAFNLLAPGHANGDAHANAVGGAQRDADAYP